MTRIEEIIDTDKQRRMGQGKNNRRVENNKTYFQ